MKLVWNSLNERFDGVAEPLIVVIVCVWLGCAGAGEEHSVDLIAIPDQEIHVNQSLRIEILVNNPNGIPLEFSFSSAPLPSIETVTAIVGTPSGGLFTFTPLVSHVGEHLFEFTVRWQGGEDSESAFILVHSAAETAPVFLRPGSGGTYELEQDPCVNFDIEVKDDDSEEVVISEAGELPAGAEVVDLGNKRGSFFWCPTPEQVNLSARWTVLLSADDGEHPSTEKSYIAVLRTPQKEDCPGEPPTVTIVSPEKGEQVAGMGVGYQVVLTAVDELGLREPPLLYYSENGPADEESLDLTGFEQVVCQEETGQWSCWIPDLGLIFDEERLVYIVASVTDNDDPSGTLCDHTTDSELLRFVALGVPPEEALGLCEPCGQSEACETGTCGFIDLESLCLQPCDDSLCSMADCVEVTSAEGLLVSVCMEEEASCASIEPGSCDDDAYEENDDLLSATMLTWDDLEGIICSDDADYFQFYVLPDEEIEVTLSGFLNEEGDLDIYLSDDADVLLGSSAGLTNEERVVLNNYEGWAYLLVEGFMGDGNSYQLTLDRRDSEACEEDILEPNDSPDTATTLLPSSLYEGMICPDNADYMAFDVVAPAHVNIFLLFEYEETDLDLELYDPYGALIGVSLHSDSDEEIDLDVGVSGTYIMRVYGYLDATGEYLAEVTVSSISQCTADADCPLGTYCGESGCVEGTCDAYEDCPTTHVCPFSSPDESTSYCGLRCIGDEDCRALESCKQFFEGWACGVFGSGSTGSSCSGHQDCAAALGCVPWINGYCAAVGCSESGQCQVGSYCVSRDGLNYCLQDCWESDDLCRVAEGYECEILYDTEDSLQFACVPG